MRLRSFKPFLVGIALLLCVCHSANAQIQLSGIVKDAETGERLDAANVVVQNGQKTVNFSMTNEQGEFQVMLKTAPDSLTLHISSLGYKPYSAQIKDTRFFQIYLEPQPIALKEVTIRPGRIWGRSDTLRFDASQFLRANDKSVEDLMKRLPGIDVDDSGNIKYKGKDVGTMYVEGMDLMGGRYKTISKNLSAQSIKGVEVLDNHQRIKSLAGKIPSEVPDINLKLKDDFKDKWTFQSKLAAGTSPDQFLYEVEANALQVARKSQSYYGVKISNTGNGITKEADEGFSTLLPLPQYRLLSDNNVSAPIKEQRWLFNKAMLATANRLYKTGEDSRLKINAFYTHDNVRQQRNDITSYFNLNDTLIVQEKTDLRVQKDNFNFSLDYEDNAETHFLRNKLDFEGNKTFGLTDISGTHALIQQINNSSFLVQNNTSFTRKQENGSVLRGQSVIGYWQNHEGLSFSDYTTRHRWQGFYAKAEGGTNIGKTKISQDYLVGISFDFNNLKKVHQLWINPTYEYLFGSFSLRGTFPLTLGYLPEHRRTMLLPKPSLRLKHKINYAWETYLYAGYSKTLGDIPVFYSQPYQLNYRTLMENQVSIPVSDNQTYSFRMDYKNTLKEFFFVTNAFYSRNQMNYTIEQEVKNNIFQLTRRQLSHVDSSMGLKVTLSKGFYSIHAKSSFDVNLSKNTSAQIRDKKMISFSFANITLTPKFSIAPSSKTEISYTGEINRLSSSFTPQNKTSLWNMSHKASFFYTHKALETSLTGEYFRNQVGDNQFVNLFYMDCHVGYKLKKVSLSFSLNNLFSQRQYHYVLYNPLSVYSSSLSLRPREALISAKFHLN